MLIALIVIVSSCNFWIDGQFYPTYAGYGCYARRRFYGNGYGLAGYGGGYGYGRFGGFYRRPGNRRRLYG